MTPELALLATGDIEVMGLLPYASNYTSLARVDDRLAVYKPTRGERPLWDFPHETLAAREVAAYVVSEAAGWDIVAPTVLREDAPLGAGSLQVFVEHDPEIHYFNLMETRLADCEIFAAFDVVVNNADRKSGHIIVDRAGRLWGVDHGLTFHVDHKLRTVIWEFAGAPLSPDVRSALERLNAALGPDTVTTTRLRELLSDIEVTAIRARVDDLMSTGRYPSPTSERPLPWPLV